MRTATAFIYPHAAIYMGTVAAGYIALCITVATTRTLKHRPHLDIAHWEHPPTHNKTIHRHATTRKDPTP